MKVLTIKHIYHIWYTSDIPHSILYIIMVYLVLIFTNKSENEKLEKYAIFSSNPAYNYKCIHDTTYK